LVRKLGAGGMGSVWLAHDLALDSSCALKLIDAEKSQSNEVRLRFEREAKAAAQLRGPHVVDVFDHGEWNNVLFIAMEYLEGEDLGARLDRVGPLEPAETYRIVAHVARALTRAHAHGIVHRDLKPENVFLVQSDEGEVAKVLDFGIAKHDAYSLQGKATQTGSFLGTPYYVSPEQARGRSTDHRSDLWSLGIIAFQCLTGKPPFESDALGELMGLILYEDLPIPTLKNPALPAALDAWWERAAARDREERFQSAKELADSLATALALDKTISVQSMAPRRPSYADGTGPFGSLGSLRNSPTPPRAVVGMSPVPLVDASLDESVETDAPVSRTRHSGHLLVEALRWRARWRIYFARLKVQRRRTLVVGAVGGGIALGVVLTLVLVRGEEAPVAGPGHVAEPPHAVASPLPPSVTPVPAPEPVPTVQRAIPIESLPMTDDESHSHPSGASSSDEAKRRAAPPPPPAQPRRRVRPDYGI
jgi:serine/threonine-protein kinase